jgi:hypothetical protein
MQARRVWPLMCTYMERRGKLEVFISATQKYTDIKSFDCWYKEHLKIIAIPDYKIDAKVLAKNHELHDYFQAILRYKWPLTPISSSTELFNFNRSRLLAFMKSLSPYVWGILCVILGISDSRSSMKKHIGT